MVVVQRYAQTLIAVVIASGMVYGGVTHFATAADVEKKFKSVQTDIKVTANEARRDRLNDELFRLRSGPNFKGRDAQIQRFESELRDVNARLRALEERR